MALLRSWLVVVGASVMLFPAAASAHHRHHHSAARHVHHRAHRAVFVAMDAEEIQAREQVAEALEITPGEAERLTEEAARMPEPQQEPEPLTAD